MVAHLLGYFFNRGFSIAGVPQKTSVRIELQPKLGLREIRLEPTREKAIPEFWNDKNDGAVLAALRADIADRFDAEQINYL